VEIGYKSSAFTYPLGADLQREEDSEDGEKRDCQRGVFRSARAKNQVGGGEFWKKSYFCKYAGRTWVGSVLSTFVAGQGGEGKYEQLHKGQMNLEF